jgi:hypothetical protein
MLATWLPLLLLVLSEQRAPKLLVLERPNRLGMIMTHTSTCDEATLGMHRLVTARVSVRL